MSLSLQTIRIRQPIAIFIVTFSILLLPGWVLPKKAYSSSDPIELDGLAGKIRMIKLYTVHDGKSINRFLDPEQLRTGNIEVEGYVTGILVLANVEMNIKVDGQTMSKIRKNQDGTYSIKYYGNVGSSEIGLTPSNHYYPKGSENDRSQSFVEGYSLFPRVVGDSVSPNCSFNIALEARNSGCDLSVQQSGYRTFQQMKLDTGSRENAIACQYLGEKLNKHMQNPEFQERLNAIAKGIGSVERAFHEDLVDQIKILDYEKIRNAVTCEERNEIWFYINTFWEEPLDELKTIAEHETLHILVDRKRLAKNFSIRELFSDLKGYDSLSRERFALITRGVASSSEEAGQVHQEFFSFINEKNFLPGMKGGHSSQNLDEFCASFLHSLMYINRLKEVLDRPIKSEGEGWQHVSALDPKKRQEILEAYTRTIKAMMEAQSNDDPSDGMRSFLAGCLAQAQSINLRTL